MAYNGWLADRIRNILKDGLIVYEEKKMMGGLTFMVNNKMCVGIVKENLMARIGDYYEEALKPGICIRNLLRLITDYYVHCS